MSEAVQLPGGTIAPLGHIAALNIQGALKASGVEADAGVIEQHIRDEIQALGSHFTLAVADVQTQAEHDLLTVKRSIAGRVAAIAAQKWVIGGIAAAVFAVGVLVGRVL